MALNSTQLAAATRLFSPAILNNIAKKSDYSEFSSLCRLAGIKHEGLGEFTVADAFDAAFGLLKKSGVRSEYVYKSALAHNVLLGVHSLATASMVTEFRAGKSKADVVIFNGTSTVYEIKSERDNLSRLVGQISDYRKVFARTFVICAPNHVAAVEQTVPQDVGIMSLARWNRIATVRDAKDRSKFLSTREIFSSLSNDEARKSLIWCGIKVPNVPNTRLRGTMLDLFSELRPSEAHEAMVATLKKTRSKESLKSALHNFPKSVMPAVMNLRLRKMDREKLVESMKVPLSSI